jgi:hypothetical protein
MKRFLKNNRYEMTDLEKEQAWQEIRRDSKAGGRSSLFRTTSLRPALTAGLTVVTLSVLGIWWTGHNTPEKSLSTQPVLVTEALVQETRQVEKLARKSQDNPVVSSRQQTPQVAL